jgi:peptidoglycan/LPS O-acetylase OafA/YrhL
MNLYKLAWLIWILGTILIVLSWDGTVGVEVGWAGFVIALIGVILSFIPHLQGKSRKLPRRPSYGDNAEPIDAEPGITAERPREERFFER